MPAPASSRHSRAVPRGEVRRQALLAALEGLLRERPLDEVQVADIAVAAGLRRSAFYFYFPTKQAAVAELLVEFANEIIEGGDDLIAARGASAPALRSAVGSMIATWQEHRHLLTAMFAARDGDPEVRELWESWMQGFVPPTAALIDRERAEGGAPPGPPSELTAALLLGMTSAALERHLRSADVTDDALGDALTHIWHSAIFGTPP